MKCGVLSELNENGIGFSELSSEEDKQINKINQSGYIVHMDQSNDRTWTVWIFKHKGIEVIDHASTRYHANRLDALKEAACLVINR